MKRAPKISVLKIELPKHVALYIKKLAAACRLTESKVVMVLLMQEVIKIEKERGIKFKWPKKLKP